MEKAIFYKILQRRNWYRNPKNLISIPSDLIYTESEFREAHEYVLSLQKFGIRYTHPEHIFYPRSLLKMKEPPLFLEYIGEPLWMTYQLMSVVGSREIHSLTETWMKSNLGEFLQTIEPQVGIVSGGARGVDQLAHLIAMKNNKPTVFVLPSGLHELYPSQLEVFRQQITRTPMCFLTEFEMHQKIHKAHFYFRNRIIAALGSITLVAQASMKSGSLLTVHHCLEIGRPILTLPGHPEMHGFDGNIQLLRDGAFLIAHHRDLLDFWRAESSSNSSFVEGV